MNIRIIAIRFCLGVIVTAVVYFGLVTFITGRNPKLLEVAIYSTGLSAGNLLLHCKLSRRSKDR
jgi:hypothetical protein